MYDSTNDCASGIEQKKPYLKKKRKKREANYELNTLVSTISNFLNLLVMFRGTDLRVGRQDSDIISDRSQSNLEISSCGLSSPLLPPQPQQHRMKEQVQPFYIHIN